MRPAPWPPGWGTLAGNELPEDSGSRAECSPPASWGMRGLLLARPRSVRADKVGGQGPGTAVLGPADWERLIRAQKEPRRPAWHRQKSDGVSGLAEKVKHGLFWGACVER